MLWHLQEIRLQRSLLTYRRTLAVQGEMGTVIVLYNIFMISCHVSVNNGSQYVVIKSKMYYLDPNVTNLREYDRYHVTYF